MPDLDLIRKLAFSFLKKADAELLRTLIDKGISAEQFFTMETAELAHALRLSQGNRFEKMERDEAIIQGIEGAGSYRTPPHHPTLPSRQ